MANELRKLMVVMPEPAGSAYSEDDALFQRVASLAESTLVTEVVLLAVSYDASLSNGFFATERELWDGRRALVDAQRSVLETFAERLDQRLDIPVVSRVRWGADTASTVVEEAQALDVGLILKASAGHGFWVGLIGNTDWDLLRMARVPVWFVAGDRDASAGVVTALEWHNDDSRVDSRVPERIDLDYRVFELGRLLARQFEAPLTLAHAFEVPRGLPGFEGYVPLLAGADALSGRAGARLAQDRERRGREVAARHGRAIRAFLDYFGVDPEHLRMAQGPTPTVVRRVAEEVQAGVLVMGASSKSWWDRLLGRVAAEPTLSTAPCDVVFVPDADSVEAGTVGSSAAATGRHPTREQVVANPSSYFGSPQALVRDDRFTREFKRQVLNAWERDVRQLMVAVAEGLPATDDNPGQLLSEVHAAMEQLGFDVRQQEDATGSGGATVAR